MPACNYTHTHTQKERETVTMREVPQRLASPSKETPIKKEIKNQISVSITLSNSILNCSTLALFTASAGSLFHIGEILYVKKRERESAISVQLSSTEMQHCCAQLSS